MIFCVEFSNWKKATGGLFIFEFKLGWGTSIHSIPFPRSRDRNLESKVKYLQLEHISIGNDDSFPWKTKTFSEINFFRKMRNFFHPEKTPFLGLGTGEVRFEGSHHTLLLTIFPGYLSFALLTNHKKNTKNKLEFNYFSTPSTALIFRSEIKIIYRFSAKH